MYWSNDEWVVANCLWMLGVPQDHQDLSGLPSQWEVEPIITPS